jgi:hypothetical protein
MKQAQKNETEQALDRTTGQKQKDRRDRDAMSPSMRQLILSFGDAASDRTWDPDAYARPKYVA